MAAEKRPQCGAVIVGEITLAPEPAYVSLHQTLVEFKIGSRIYAGFGIVLLLLLALAAVGYLSLTGVSSTFARYATISDNTVRMTEIDRDVVSLRASMREYVRSNSPTALKSLRDVGRSARDFAG